MSKNKKPKRPKVPKKPRPSKYEKPLVLDVTFKEALRRIAASEPPKK